MDAAANPNVPSQGNAAQNPFNAASQMSGAAQMTGQGHAGDHITFSGCCPNAFSPPTPRELLLEEQIKDLTAKIEAVSNQRTLRLREIAIDTAIRQHGASGPGHTGANDKTVMASAAAFFAFLDTGAVPA